ncbi:hypothetical protein BJP37_11325 [Moorena bouillonii PNG]|uniref:Calcineurin-like phosphoesterase domain-containing protein n=2 Tax=Moorena TaxID=1155738 RepID=A0A1U7N0P9_9CYAN|nr:hypothetical protein BJP37_11325 [Moorena bouillonii PNG]
MRSDSDPESMREPLITDILDSEDGLGLEQLDYLVVSGDLTNRATPQEFEQARQLISGLMERFDLTAERCIIVPGNHDLSWDEEVYEWKKKRLVEPNKLQEGTYVEQGDGFLLRVEERYPQRFKNFSECFYQPLLGKEYPLEFKQQCLPFLFPDTRIQFLAMNSCSEIDEYFRERSNIRQEALTQGLKVANRQIQQAKREEHFSKEAGSILRIAVWHHPITGNEKIAKDAFLERLQKADFQLCLHGHIHEERTDIIGYLHPTRKIYVAGAGSFGARTKARPESKPRFYNLLEVKPDHSKIRVHTRCLRKDGGAWTGWYVWHKKNSRSREAYYEINLQKKTI